MSKTNLYLQKLINYFKNIKKRDSLKYILPILFILLLIYLLLKVYIYKNNPKKDFFKNNDVFLTHLSAPFGDKKYENFTNNKTLIIYCYKEDEQTKKNLNFFVKNGLVNNPNYNYVFLINDKKCTVNIPKNDNIEIIYNDYSIYDIFTYKRYINNKLKENKNYFDKYEYFYFINSSCIGPFIIPLYKKTWIDLLNEELNEFDFIAPIIEFPNGAGIVKKYIGFNEEKDKCIPFLHTYMFGMNKEGFIIFLDLLNKVKDEKQESVMSLERSMTYYFILNNKKINSFLLKYKNIDLNNKDNWIHSKWNNTDTTCIEVPYNYDGIDVNPFEVIFVKNIRNHHNFRLKNNSGISEVLQKYLNNYILWY
jgi:hypothetical protein